MIYTENLTYCSCEFHRWFENPLQKRKRTIFFKINNVFSHHSSMLGLYTSYNTALVCWSLPNNTIGPIPWKRKLFRNYMFVLIKSLSLQPFFHIGILVLVRGSQFLRVEGCRTSWNHNSINFKTTTEEVHCSHGKSFFFVVQSSTRFNNDA